MPETMKTMIDGVLSPATVFVGSLVALTVLYLGRRWFVRPAVAWRLLAGFARLLRSLAVRSAVRRRGPCARQHPHRGDALPAGVFHVAGNRPGRGERSAACSGASRRGRRSAQAKVFTWPDLVYSELICMVLVMAVLLAWSLLVPAPLEQPANPAVTPNPSKAPWYFLGIQELLFYGDPWLVGVAVPCLMVLGLMAVPYLDFNPEGSGYYTIARRRLAYCRLPVRLLAVVDPLDRHGHVLSRTELEFLRTLRGPRSCKSSLRRPTSSCRRSPGWPPGDLFSGAAAASGPYRAGRLPPADGAPRVSRSSMVLLLFMLALPLKMLLQWTFDVQYIVALPQWSFNF